MADPTLPRDGTDFIATGSSQYLRFRWKLAASLNPNFALGLRASLILCSTRPERGITSRPQCGIAIEGRGNIKTQSIENISRVPLRSRCGRRIALHDRRADLGQFNVSVAFQREFNSTGETILFRYDIESAGSFACRVRALCPVRRRPSRCRNQAARVRSPFGCVILQVTQLQLLSRLLWAPSL